MTVTNLLPRPILTTLTAGLLAALPAISWSGNIVVTNMTSISSQGNETAASDLSLRRLIVPNQGLKRGSFKWNAVTNTFALNGALTADDAYYGDIQLWKFVNGTGATTSEKLDIAAGGLNVTAVSFKAPNGITYTKECAPDSPATNFGMNAFWCSIPLAAGQTTFGNGAYVVSYKLSTGTVTRTFYVSGAYPLIHRITYPINGATGIPTQGLKVTWTSVGAVNYDFILRDAAQNQVYGPSLTNSIEAAQSHTLPATVVLQPQTNYYLTIEAKAPVVNGGAKGIKQVVVFKTK